MNDYTKNTKFNIRKFRLGVLSSFIITTIVWIYFLIPQQDSRAEQIIINLQGNTSGIEITQMNTGGGLINNVMTNSNVNEKYEPKTTGTILNNNGDTEIKESNQGGSEFVLNYVPELISDVVGTYRKINSVVNNTGITDSIFWSCSIARSQKHCINLLLGISKAESSIFKRCYNYNCFGIKPAGTIKSYSSYDESIKDWVRRYNKYWYRNNNAQDMLNSNYCVSTEPGGCEDIGSNWRKSVDSFIGFI